MNKHELIKKYETKGEQLKELPVVAIGDVLKNLRELDEPEKIQIPQFVADWIEYCKFTHVNLQHAFIVGDVYFYNYANQKDFSKLKEFLETENNQATFARAWLDGYEVEREKQYKVVMPNISSTGGVLTRIKHNDSWIWIDTIGTIVEGRTHTSKELEEAGFGWVFDCPGIEVEEVEE